MSTMLITGGTGFLGHHLVTGLTSFFSNELATIRVFDRQPGSRPLPPQAVSVQGDILDESSLESAMKGVKYLFHLAGKTGTSPNHNDEQSFWRVNVDGTRNVTRVAACSNVEVMVNLSSSSVYGNSSVDTCDETAETNPLTTYGKTKKAAEEVARTEATQANMRLITIRPANIFGEGSSFNVLLTMMRAVKKQRFFLLSNAKESYSNYVYVGDVVDAMIRLALMPDVEGVFNVNTPQELQAFATAVAHAVVSPPNFRRIPYAPAFAVAAFLDAVEAIVKRPFPITRGKIQTLANTQVFSSGKLQNVLADWPRYGTEEGLRRLARSYEEKGLL